MLSVGSLFSGVGGFDLGFERAGMRIVFQCELDHWCRGVLAQQWPGVPCYEDVRSVGNQDAPHEGERRWEDVRRLHAQLASGQPSVSGVDLLCGGFPCQDLSVAGRRAGLAGERSGLFFEFARCADELVRPGGWIVVENVPGLLSSQGGRDFAVVVRTLGDIGFHDLAWRVLDSRYFGVPQRRRRVFIVGRRAAGTGAREVLLEPESGGGDFAPSREAGPRVAASLSRGSASPGVSVPGRRQEDDENIVSTLQGGSGRRGHRIDAEGAAGNHLVGVGRAERDGDGSADDDATRGSAGSSWLGSEQNAPALVSRYAKGTDSDATDALIAHTLRAEGFDASEDGTGRGTPLVADPLVSRSSRGKPTPLAPGHNTDGHIVSTAPDAYGVRAPSGLPRRVDDPQPDGPRYAAMGNAVTVNVAVCMAPCILAW